MNCKLTTGMRVSWTNELVYSIVDLDGCALILGVMTLAQCKRWARKNGYTIVKESN